MKFNTIGRKITVSEKITDYLQKKIGKLDKFFKDEAEARIVLSVVKDKVSVEASIFAGGMIYRAVETDEDALAAIDKIVDVIERQIRKNKTRLEKKIKREAVLDTTLLSGASYTDAGDEPEFEIVKTKRFQLKPMSPEEAVLHPLRTIPGILRRHQRPGHIAASGTQTLRRNGEWVRFRRPFRRHVAIRRRPARLAVEKSIPYTSHAQSLRHRRRR